MFQFISPFRFSFRPSRLRPVGAETPVLADDMCWYQISENRKILLLKKNINSLASCKYKMTCCYVNSSSCCAEIVLTDIWITHRNDFIGFLEMIIEEIDYNYNDIQIHFLLCVSCTRSPLYLQFFNNLNGTNLISNLKFYQHIWLFTIINLKIYSNVLHNRL